MASNPQHLEALRKRIQGPVFSVVTPFSSDDDSIDFHSLEHYLEYAYLAGARIFYVMGYNSRFSQLSWSEIQLLNRFVASTIKQLGSDTISIVADPLHCSTAVSIEFCKHSEDIGADLISLIFREKFYSREQVVQHYKLCASSSSTGVLIHEMPFLCGKTGHPINWPLDLLDELADIPNIIAIKEDTKDDGYSRDAINTIKDRLAVIISGGGKRQWLRFVDLGCTAWLNGIGVFEPKLAIRFMEAYQQGDENIWRRIIDDIERPFFANGVDVYGWHLIIRAALELRGHFCRHERMPMMPLSDREFEDVRRWFEQLPIDELAR